MKICTKCNKEKDLEEFYKQTGSNNLQGSCKECTKARSRKWQSVQENKDKRNKRVRKLRNSNNDYKEQQKKYYKENKNKIYKAKRIWVANNKDKVDEATRKHRSVKSNRQKGYKQKRIRYKEDPFFNFSTRLRSRVVTAFKKSNWRKNSPNEKMLGCNYETAFNYIESKFTDGMSWDNRSEWHIDHIIPLASAKNEEEMIKLCHYTNLQPLWAEDNLKKSNKMPKPPA